MVFHKILRMRPVVPTCRGRRSKQVNGNVNVASLFQPSQAGFRPDGLGVGGVVNVWAVDRQLSAGLKTAGPHVPTKLLPPCCIAFFFSFFYI